MGFLFTATIGKSFTMAVGIQVTIFTRGHESIVRRRGQGSGGAGRAGNGGARSGRSGNGRMGSGASGSSPTRGRPSGRSGRSRRRTRSTRSSLTWDGRTYAHRGSRRWRMLIWGRIAVLRRWMDGIWRAEGGCAGAGAGEGRNSQMGCRIGRGEGLEGGKTDIRDHRF